MFASLLTAVADAKPVGAPNQLIGRTKQTTSSMRTSSRRTDSVNDGEVSARVCAASYSSSVSDENIVQSDQQGGSCGTLYKAIKKNPSLATRTTLPSALGSGTIFVLLHISPHMACIYVNLHTFCLCLPSTSVYLLVKTNKIYSVETLTPPMMS